MKPSNNQALNQALDSIGAIRSHLELMPLSETIAYDAVCMRLILRYLACIQTSPYSKQWLFETESLTITSELISQF